MISARRLRHAPQHQEREDEWARSALDLDLHAGLLGGKQIATAQQLLEPPNLKLRVQTFVPNRMAMFRVKRTRWKTYPTGNPESRDRLKLDERRNFALSRFELPKNPMAKVPAKETSAGPAVHCHSG
ncbi:MAG: hypothetical protein WCQ77_03950 [Planctomycetota bacterium]